MYWYSIYILDASTNPINKLVNYDLSEPVIGYAMVLEHHTVYLLQLVVTYLGCTINSYNNHVSGAFLQLTHYPDIFHGNVVSVALYFDGNYGPASWEPVAWVQCFLAQWMFQHVVSGRNE